MLARTAFCQLPNAKAILNEGSLLMWSPLGSLVTVKQNIYEAAYGNDINFHAQAAGGITGATVAGGQDGTSFFVTVQ